MGNHAAQELTTGTLWHLMIIIIVGTMRKVKKQITPDCSSFLMTTSSRTMSLSSSSITSLSDEDISFTTMGSLVENKSIKVCSQLNTQVMMKASVPGRLVRAERGDRNARRKSGRQGRSIWGWEGRRLKLRSAAAEVRSPHCHRSGTWSPPHSRPVDCRCIKIVLSSKIRHHDICVCSRTISIFQNKSHSDSVTTSAEDELSSSRLLCLRLCRRRLLDELVEDDED